MFHRRLFLGSPGLSRTLISTQTGEAPNGHARTGALPEISSNPPCNLERRRKEPRLEEYPS